MFPTSSSSYLICTCSMARMWQLRRFAQGRLHELVATAAVFVKAAFLSSSLWRWGARGESCGASFKAYTRTSTTSLATASSAARATSFSSIGLFSAGYLWFTYRLMGNFDLVRSIAESCGTSFSSNDPVQCVLSFTAVLQESSKAATRALEHTDFSTLLSHTSHRSPCGVGVWSPQVTVGALSWHNGQADAPDTFSHSTQMHAARSLTLRERAGQGQA